MEKRLLILGSTGSIGTKTLDVVRDFSDRFEVIALSTHGQVALLAEQVREFRPRFICVTSPDKQAEAEALARAEGVQLFSGADGLVAMINAAQADMAVIATVGFAGTAPTLAAIACGMTVALANKEVLVCAGRLVMQAAHRAGVRILPVDSEHNAIFQCLNGSSDLRGVRRLILTASGGPFRGMKRDQMAGLTAADALKHPTWAMGAKITIDCSTLMNKGFEAIEAAHLFDVSMDRVDVVVHPQSVIHSMVEYDDGSIIAQMGVTDMYFPIQNILMYPERLPNKFPPLDFAAVRQLTFEAPDRETFPCLNLAYRAMNAADDRMPTVLNGANEVAVARFLAGEIGYLDIPRIIESAMDSFKSTEQSRPPIAGLEDICMADAWARDFAHKAGVVPA